MSVHLYLPTRIGDTHSFFSVFYSFLLTYCLVFPQEEKVALFLMSSLYCFHFLTQTNSCLCADNWMDSFSFQQSLSCSGDVSHGTFWNGAPETTVWKHDVTHKETVCSLMWRLITLWKKCQVLSRKRLSENSQKLKVLKKFFSEN